MPMKIVRPPAVIPDLPPPPDPSTLGGKVWLVLKEGIQHAAEAAIHPFSTAFQWGIEKILDILGHEADQALGGMIREMIDDPETPPELKHMLNWMMTEEGQLAQLVKASAVGTGVSASVGGMMAGLTAGITRASNRKFRPQMHDPQASIYAKWREALSPEEAHQEMSSTGWHDKRQETFELLLRPLLSEQILIQLWHREELGETALDAILMQRGYTQVRIDRLKEVAKPIPGASDLISMAVREAWREDFARDWGTDEDFPAPFAEWLGKQGYEADWAKRYWRAHWQLPSLLQGFEMLHRKELKKEELLILMRAQDIMPGYREKLINIAYRPYTRVDVRRMYGLGVLGEEEVKTAYMDIGFDEEKAENMTEFTIKYEKSAQRDLAKTELLRGYTRGVNSDTETKAKLRDIGYSEADASFLLSLEDLKLAQDMKDDQLSAVKANYVEGVWEVPETTAAMGKIGLTAQEEQRLLDTWDIERQRRIARPSTGQILGFFERSVIKEGEARDELDLKGFSDTYINWYMEHLETVKQDRLERESDADQRRLLTQTKSPSKAEIRVWWIGGYITEERFREWMGEMGYEATTIELYIEQVEAEHERELEMMLDDEIRRRFEVLRYPSKTDLKKFFEKEVIDEETYREEMALQGFTEKAIDRFVELIIGEQEEE